MREINIKGSEHVLYKPFKELYAVSFPIFEQRTEFQQECAFRNGCYHLTGYCEEERLVGFLSYWEFDSYVYIEHFAVDVSIRGKGYGSRILREFVGSRTKTVLLEIDPVVDDISRARLRFYERCGFVQNPYPHTHPAYRVGYHPHSLVVLTSGNLIPKTLYRQFAIDLENVVMNFSNGNESL